MFKLEFASCRTTLVQLKLHVFSTWFRTFVCHLRHVHANKMGPFSLLEGSERGPLAPRGSRSPFLELASVLAVSFECAMECQPRVHDVFCAVSLSDAM